MPRSISFSSGEPNPRLLHAAFFIEQVGLLLVIQFAVINVLSRLFTAVHQLFAPALLGMSFPFSLAALCCAIALGLPRGGRSQWPQRLGKALAASAVSLALMSAGIRHVMPGMQAFGQVQIPKQAFDLASEMGILLLGTGVFLVESRRSWKSHAADLVASCSGFLLLMVTLQFLFAAMGVRSATVDGFPPFSFIFCWGLLTFVLILRRAEHGIFSLFLGRGIGGRVARMLLPVVVLINIGREIGRVRILRLDLIPAHYIASILASTAILIGFALVALLCGLINGMQTEIENFTLRDELTRLYSYRGFNLFADQAFRLARRSRQSFGVLFVDMDDLKKINDELGHHAGSACLGEIAKLLRIHFRETEVIGRLGGDEFVVAGQFDESGISQGMNRFRLRVRESRIPGIHLPLSVSMGYAVSEGSSHESLKSLLSRADKAMYKEKRAKKRSASNSNSPAVTARNSHTAAAVDNAFPEQKDGETNELAV